MPPSRRSFPLSRLLVAFLSVSSPFAPHAFADSFEALRASDSLTYVYGVEAGCRAAPADVVQAFLAGVKVLGEVCDTQNAAAAASGSRACPPSTCLATFEPGDTEPPKLEVEISWSRNTSDATSGVPASRYVSSGGSPSTGTLSGGTFSGGGGSPGGSPGGGFGGGSGASSQGIVVRVKLTAMLGRQPDKLTCVNPMSQASRDGLLEKVVDLAARGGSCEGQP